MRVLVTGANGFVGLNVVQALCEAGHEAHAFARAGVDVSFLSLMSARVHRGELRDRARLHQAMRGVDAVIHCAGDGRHEGANAAQRCAIEVEATRAVVDAAVDTGVGRFVHTSSTATIGAEDDPERLWNEDTPLGGIRAENPCARTKSDAESIVRAAIVRGLDSIVLNPAEIIGAWDRAARFWGRLILGVASERLRFVPPGGGSFCAASEVGRAHVAALTRGEIGARYILAGTDATYAELVETAAAVTEVRPPATGRARDEASRGLEEGPPDPSAEDVPPTTPERLHLLQGHYHFDASRAVRDLGFRVVSLADMVRDACAWYREHGFLPPRARGPGGTPA